MQFLQNRGVNHPARRSPVRPPLPPMNLQFKHGSLNLCIPYLGLASKRDSIGLTILVGFLESPKHGQMVSRRFQRMLEEIRREIGKYAWQKIENLC